jgi:hypothetical protein
VHHLAREGWGTSVCSTEEPSEAVAHLAVTDFSAPAVVRFHLTRGYAA